MIIGLEIVVIVETAAAAAAAAATALVANCIHPYAHVQFAFSLLRSHAHIIVTASSISLESLLSLQGARRPTHIHF